MPTQWLQERPNGSKNEPEMPPLRAFCGTGASLSTAGDAYSRRENIHSPTCVLSLDQHASTRASSLYMYIFMYIYIYIYIYMNIYIYIYIYIYIKLFMYKPCTVPSRGVMPRRSLNPQPETLYPKPETRNPAPPPPIRCQSACGPRSQTR